MTDRDKILRALRHHWSIEYSYHDRANGTWFVVLQPRSGGRRLEFSSIFGLWNLLD